MLWLKVSGLNVLFMMHNILLFFFLAFA